MEEPYDRHIQEAIRQVAGRILMVREKCEMWNGVMSLEEVWNGGDVPQKGVPGGVRMVA